MKVEKQEIFITLLIWWKKKNCLGIFQIILKKKKVFEIFNNTMEIYNKCKQIDLHKDTIVPEDKKGGNFVIQHIFKSIMKNILI